MSLFVVPLIASVVAVTFLHWLASPDLPSEVFSWAVFDIAEFLAWLLGLVLFSVLLLRPLWLKAALAVLSVPYSMLAFSAAEKLVACALGEWP
jgi:hypothetical protein